MISFRIGQLLDSADATPTDLIAQALDNITIVAHWAATYLGLSASDIKLLIGTLAPLGIYLLWTSSAGPPAGPPPPGWDM